jgi:ankyrin repeat protein
MEIEHPDNIDNQKVLITDSRLLLEVPKEILTKIAQFIDKYCLATHAETLVKFSLVCKKLENLRMPDVIKSLLNLDQKSINSCLTSYNLYHKDYTSFIRLLLAMGADVTYKNHNNATCLHLARNECLAQLYIKHGANIHHQNNQGQTPLHYAVIFDRADVVKVLLKNKANMYLIDHDKKSSVDYALEYHQLECTKILIEHGLDPSIAYNGMTLAEWVNLKEQIQSFKLSTIESIMAEKPIFNSIVETIHDSCSIS